MASEQERITKISFISGDWNMFRVKTNNYNSKVIVILKDVLVSLTIRMQSIGCFLTNVINFSMIHVILKMMVNIL